MCKPNDVIGQHPSAIVLGLPKGVLCPAPPFFSADQAAVHTCGEISNGIIAGCAMCSLRDQL